MNYINVGRWHCFEQFSLSPLYTHTECIQCVSIMLTTLRSLDGCNIFNQRRWCVTRVGVEDARISHMHEIDMTHDDCSM